MLHLDPDTVLQMPKNELVSLIEAGQVPRRPQKIWFYAPSFVQYKTKHYCSQSNVFPSISVTGSSCALNCLHCNGKVLDTMIPAKTPDALFDLCKRLKDGGAVGCLISGGCLPDGSVPLENFVDCIGRIKNELGFTVVVHTGVVDVPVARKLKNAGVDAALIDVVGSNQTIREVYRLDVTVTDYERSLQAFRECDLPFVPHVLVGLHHGELKGELNALKLVAKYSPSAVIMIAFMPIHGTPMENVKPSTPEDIARTIVSARLLMPDTPLALGCMRPKREHRKKTDMLAVKAGVNAIAFPTEEAVNLAKAMKLETVFSPLCCSQIFLDYKL
jgi:uncharacterized radical SAM superfamily protein